MKWGVRLLAYLALVLIVACLSGCGHAPEPEIRTVEVRVPVDDPACSRAAMERLGAAPAYPDTPEAIRGASDLFERVKLLLAGRGLRVAHEAALMAALKACASPPG